MKCPRCSRPFKIVFGDGFCSSSCRDYKTVRQKYLDRLMDKYAYVDASVELEPDVRPKLGRKGLVNAFRELQNVD